MADALDRSISPPSQIIDLLDCMNELKVSVTGLPLRCDAAPGSCRLSCDRGRLLQMTITQPLLALVKGPLGVCPNPFYLWNIDKGKRKLLYLWNCKSKREQAAYSELRLGLIYFIPVLACSCTEIRHCVRVDTGYRYSVDK